MRRLILVLIATLTVWAVAPAFAQQPVPPQSVGPNNAYGDPVCGVWNNGVWQDNGRCPGYVTGRRRARVAGTITFVKGHLVTVQQADRNVVINDQPALNRMLTGRVAVGRQIVAYGYWRDNNFYATVIE